MLRDTKTVDTIKPFPFCEDGSKDLTFELPASDFQALVKDTIEIYNLIAGLLRDHKVLQPKASGLSPWAAACHLPGTHLSTSGQWPWGSLYSLQFFPLLNRWFPKAL